MPEKKDLVQLIKDNPGAKFSIDNDCWFMTTPDGETDIARDGEVIPRGSGYGSGCLYGGDVLQALAEIVGVKVESV